MYFYLPKSARAYILPQSVRTHYFCSGPMRADPIFVRNQSASGAARPLNNNNDDNDDNMYY